MQPIVLQLQALASSHGGSTTELLRKARMVATKLKLNEFNEWLGHEMHGYPLDGDVPDYRLIFGDIRANNPMNGLCIPVRFEPELNRKLSGFTCHQSVGSIEDIVGKDDDGTLSVPFSDQQMAFIHSHLEDWQRSWMMPFRRISRSQLVAVLDKVRGIILDWSLELESQGILGEDMTFSDEEKQRAASHQIHIGSFQGVLGDVANSTITQNLTMTVKANDIASLRLFLAQSHVPAEEIAKLETAIKADEPPKSKSGFGKNVTEWLGRQVTNISSGAYKIAVNSGLTHIGDAVWKYYGF